MKYTLKSAYQITLLLIGVLCFIGSPKADPVACTHIPKRVKIDTEIKFTRYYTETHHTDTHHKELGFGDDSVTNSNLGTTKIISIKTFS